MGSNAKVLVVDDDPDMLGATRLFLEARGFRVVTAQSPGEGLRRLEEEEPDVVVLDVMMPNSTEGFQWLLRLRQHPDTKLREVPVIMLTSIHETTRMRFHEGDADETGDYLPAQAFFDKPVDPDLLAAKIETLLAGKSAG
ncbi:MAG: response regulator [Armatimonadetes bacterium]|nr:response regulator [Armatimonadota bacterium]